MLLYHGTTAAAAEKIKQVGLQPRLLTNVKTTYPALPSRSDCVYLTKWYAGVNALLASSDPMVERAIIEIETSSLPNDFFLPDEDYVEQQTRPPGAATSQKGLSVRTAYIRKNLEKYRNLFEMSVTDGGRCAYKGTVPVNALTRTVSFPLSPEHWVFKFLSRVGQRNTLHEKPAIKEKLALCTRWFFGDSTDAEWASHRLSLKALPRQGFRVMVLV